MPYGLQNRRMLSSVMLLASSFVNVNSLTSSFSSRPYAGYVTTGQRVEFLVVGTSHFQCNSAAEVRSVILEERPDGVVVELDPERVVRLTKEHALSSDDDQQQLFGADLLSAIDTSRELHIPLFIGDEYTKETRARFLQTILSPTTYSPSKLWSSFLMSGSSDDDSKVNLIQTFMDDPRKLTPLVISLAPPFLVLVVTTLLRDHVSTADASSNGAAAAIGSVEVLLSLLVSVVATSKVYNTLIADRDAVLASKAMNAANVVASLKDKETFRKTWTFDAADDHDSTVGYTTENNTATTSGTPKDDESNSNNMMMPLFTLKRPLEADAVRNLNLFEPRWLAMIDDLRKEAQGKNEEEYPQFGCVSCTNKFYSVVKQKNGKEGRYADLIVQRTGRIATLVDVIEGKRPSGARKVYTRIQGGQPFTVEEDEVFVSEEGYLMTPKNTILFADGVGDGTLANSKDDVDNISPPSKKKDSIKIVVVAGLLHVNGIIDTIAAAETL